MTPQKHKRDTATKGENMAQQSKSQKKKNSGKTAASVILIPLIIAALGGGIYLAAKDVLGNRSKKPQSSDVTAEQQTDEAITTATTSTTITTTTETLPAFPDKAMRSDTTYTITDTTKVLARNSLLIECSGNGGNILAEHDADAEIYPASMTKMMTLLTFSQLCAPEALDATILMDAEVIRAQEEQMAYVAGFKAGEACRVRDLAYAMMLPSGADAAVMLATYAAGSEADFIAEMNQLAQTMGLEHSHFDNVTGLHENTHTSSLHDIARILMAAIRDPFCAEVMSTLQYTTAATAEHPNGIDLVSTTLSRMVGNELERLSDPLHVIGGKTGFTNPAGQCLATWAQSDSGKTYICVVAGSTTFQPLDAVGDVLTLYQLTELPLSDIQRIELDEADLPLYEHY